VTESDRGRLEYLLERYAGLLRSAIHRYCPRDLGISAADVEQEARVRLWRALQRETELGDPASYVYRVAVTATIDAVRRARTRREDQLREGPDEDDAEQPFPDDARNQPDAQLERRELMARVGAALSTLSDDRRRAVELHLQGLTLAEIAELLSWSEARTRNLVYRGMDDLRGALRREGIEYP
jgi:RNA polymerase sigma-70 factor (ECF subfamily)